ncbi:MAG: cyclic nucleotide-binding domain-containing protein [Candidatus Gracilibacteria bacterium]|nr:cyclic nucleotide-binding domain-containing protein [Candidatus Gracilibacteria bacterium]
MFDKIPLFSSLDNNEKNKLSLFCQERLIRSGEVLFNESDEATALYIVKEGKLKVYRDRSEGEQVLGFIENGDIVGEMAIFEAIGGIPKKRMASVQAAKDTDLIVIMNYSILDLSKKYSEIYEKILKIIEERRQKNGNF